jgi:nucleotide-binding universal stress UspA family protein
MGSLNRLLAATDLSAPARHAAERAALVAAQIGAALDVVHVASLAPLAKLRRLVAELPPGLEEQALDAAWKELRELAATLRERHGVSAGVHVVTGALLPELVDQADALAADMIVLGARGAGFMRHVLLGSTAERMIGRAGRPMLVVKHAPQGRYRVLLVPVDLSASSLPALKTARAIAPGADVVLLHVFEAPFEGALRFAAVDEETIRQYRVAAKQDALQRLRALCDDAGLPRHDARLMALHGDPVQQVIEQEQEWDCDLIVMGKHGENALEDRLLGSVTRHVLSRSQCDVLVAV